MTPELECRSCDHKFSSNEVALTNVDITNEYFRINWNCLKCETEGLTLFINNSINSNKDKGKNKK
ncbi:MAG: hypothetical protein MUO21_00095 [Nitrososphaeraceae archaeon]|nr:hypothetical protein [Nitrososphaeraceae archaeon]